MKKWPPFSSLWKERNRQAGRDYPFPDRCNPSRGKRQGISLDTSKASNWRTLRCWKFYHGHEFNFEHEFIWLSCALIMQGYMTAFMQGRMTAFKFSFVCTALSRMYGYTQTSFRLQVTYGAIFREHRAAKLYETLPTWCLLNPSVQRHQRGVKTYPHTCMHSPLCSRPSGRHFLLL